MKTDHAEQGVKLVLKDIIFRGSIAKGSTKYYEKGFHNYS